MRKTVLLLLLFSLVAVACIQQPDGTVADPEQETAEQETAAQEVPRVEITATPALPPTYTPEPAGNGGHIAPVSTRTIHVVQAGDTLGQIAAKHGVDVKFLADSNRIYNYDLIRTGDVLYIPEHE
jgi:nucleoid-associated protein YgaU